MRRFRPLTYCLLLAWLQVCTLSARELSSAAAAQLGAWMQQQEDLEVPPSGLEVMQVGTACCVPHLPACTSRKQGTL